MGYCKKWNPPTAPSRDNLAAWKMLFSDLHENLLLGGWVQTDTPDQLVIDDVEELPADNAYAGFIEYALDDGLQAAAPVIMSLEFGCGQERADSNTSASNGANRLPRIRASVSFKGVSSQSFGCPQGYSPTLGASTNTNTLHGASYLCSSPGRGFFGIVYGAGTRRATHGYIGSTFSLFVQRTTDGNGNPTSDGLALYYNGLSSQSGTAISGGIWANANLLAAFSEFLPSHGNSRSRAYATRIPAAAEVKSANGELLLEPIYYSAPALKQFPYLFSYNYAALAEGSEIALEIGPGQALNFIALGRETSMSIDTYDAQRAGLVMLFDEG